MLLSGTPDHGCNIYLPIIPKLPTHMKKVIADVIHKLTSRSYPQIIEGLSMLEPILQSLVPSVKASHQTQVMDSKLSAFIALQDSFQFNLVIAFLDVYDYFGANPKEVQPCHILNANHHVCGLLLIHRDSRKLFERERNMQLILSLLDKRHSLSTPKVCVSLLSLLVHILVKSSHNLRTFEKMQGCEIIGQHLQFTEESCPSLEELSLKVVEFYIFYLTDEKGLEGKTRSIEEKANFLRPDFPGIDELLRNLENLNTLKGPNGN